MEKRKLTPNVTPNTLESMIEYTLFSSILYKICELTKNSWNIQKMDTKLNLFDICSKSKHGEHNAER
jgi:hypothetical protein